MNIQVLTMGCDPLQVRWSGEVKSSNKEKRETTYVTEDLF